MPAGSADSGVFVTVNNIEISIEPDGSFRENILFSEVDSRVLKIRAFDADGNETLVKKRLRTSSE